MVRTVRLRWDTAFLVLLFAAACGGDAGDPPVDDGEGGQGGGAAGSAGASAGRGGSAGGASGGTGGGAAGSAGAASAGSTGGGAAGSVGGGGGVMDAGVSPDAATSPSTDAAMPAEQKFADLFVSWNGDGVGDGNVAKWLGRGQEGKTTIGASTKESHSPTHAVAFAMHELGYGEFGWGLRGVPANKYKYLVFWTNMVRDPGKASPGTALVTLKVGGGYAAPGGGRGVSTIKYSRMALLGGWQQVVIPVADIVGNAGGANISELLVGIAGCGTPSCAFTLYIDDIGFAN